MLKDQIAREKSGHWLSIMLRNEVTKHLKHKAVNWVAKQTVLLRFNLSHD